MSRGVKIPGRIVSLQLAENRGKVEAGGEDCATAVPGAGAAATRPLCIFVGVLGAVLGKLTMFHGKGCELGTVAT